MVGSLDTLRVPMFEGLGVWVEGFGFRPPSARPLQHRIPFTRFEIVPHSVSSHPSQVCTVQFLLLMSQPLLHHGASKLILHDRPRNKELPEAHKKAVGDKAHAGGFRECNAILHTLMPLSVWFLVGNGGMDLVAPIESPITVPLIHSPHSLLRTRQGL